MTSGRGRSLALIVCGVGILVASFSSLPQAQQNPCDSEEFRQFDFWIGQWEVRDKAGKIVGSNHIYPILDGCALSENWIGATGNPGVSYNFYDAAANKWHQTWISNGGPLYLEGGLLDGKMVLSGYRPGKGDGADLHRITWTPLVDGRVRQHWQVSHDEGKSWHDVFVGFYVRLNNSTSSL